MTYRHRLAQQRAALRPRPATVLALPLRMCKSRDASVAMTMHGLSPQTCSAARFCCGEDALAKLRLGILPWPDTVLSSQLLLLIRRDMML